MQIRELQHPDRLPVALRIRHAELPLRTLVDVPPLLLADEGDGSAVELPEPGHHGAVVGSAPVAVQLEPVVEEPLHVVERVRPFRMTCELDRAPDFFVGRLRGHAVELALQALELPGKPRTAEQRQAAQLAQPFTEAELGLTRH